MKKHRIHLIAEEKKVREEQKMEKDLREPIRIPVRRLFRHETLPRQEETEMPLLTPRFTRD